MQGSMGQVYGRFVVSRIFGLVVGCFAIVLLAGCAGLPEPDPQVNYTSNFATDDPLAYRLRPNDRMKLLVFGQDAISGDYVVAADGAIDVSQVGKVQAAGLSVDQLEAALAERLRDGHVAEPQVSVLLDVDRPVYVTGAVANPGQIPFKANLDARAAVAFAGGYRRGADTGTIFITRAGTSAEKRYGIGEHPVINPGDTIRIPDRG